MLRLALAGLCALSLFARSTQSTKKMTPPAPTAPRPYEFPKAASKTLANGLRVYVVEDHRLPLVSASMQILAGGAYAAPEKAGLASLTATLLREGTAKRSSQDLARAVDNAGGDLSASAGDDTANIGMTFMKAYANLGMELMADITLHPVFAQEELERQVRQSLSNLAVSFTNPEFLAPLAAGRALYGTHPYAYPGSGTPETLAKITRDDILAFYKANYAPARAWIAIAGDVTPDEAFALVEKHFGSWQAPAAADAKLPAPPAPKNQVLVIDMPDAVQTQIVVGHLGVARNHPDYLALQVANQIFGGSFNSRLNMKLRANEGLTYGANSGFDPNRQAGTFQASTFTRTEKTADAIRMLVDLLKEFKANPSTESEFNEAKSFLIGSFGVSTETASSVAGRVLTTNVYNLDQDYFPKYREHLQALTREQMNAALQRFLQPEKLTIVAVGNAKEFSKQLEPFGPVRVIAGDAADYIAADLVKVKKQIAATAESTAAAKALVNAAITAMGGLEKLAAVKDLTLSGPLSLTMGQTKMDAETTEQILYPGHYKMSMKLPMGLIVQSVAGDSAWMAQGPQTEDLPPNLVADLKKSLSVSAGGLGLLRDAAQGKAEVVATGASTALWKQGSFEIALTFDPATHFLTVVDYKAMGMMGPAQTETTFSDFQAIDGLTLPAGESVKQNGQQVGVRKITGRKLNAGLEPAAFARK